MRTTPRLVSKSPFCSSSPTCSGAALRLTRSRARAGGDPVDHRGVGVGDGGGRVQADLGVGAPGEGQLHHEILAPLQLVADRVEGEEEGRQPLGDPQQRGVEEVPGGLDRAPVGAAHPVGEAQALVVGAALAAVALGERGEVEEEGGAGGAGLLDRAGDRLGDVVGARLRLARGLAAGHVEAGAQLGQGALAAGGGVPLPRASRWRASRAASTSKPNCLVASASRWWASSTIRCW